MRYIDYFIKCIIRRIVRIIFKPKILITILFILLILTLSLYHNSYAAEGNIYDVYNSINNDLVNRLDKVSSSNTSFYNYFNNLDYSFLVYYGAIDGNSMFTTSYNSSTLNVAFYPSDFSFLNMENKTVWGGASCSQSRTPVSNTVSFNVFSFDVDGTYIQYGTATLYLPTELVNYRSSVVSEYLREKKNVQEITNSITEGTDKIDNSITSTDYDDSVVNIDTSSADIDDTSSTQLFTAIFTNFKNLLDNSNWQTVETIDIPIPHSQEKLQLKSDILSNIVGNTFIATLINVAWYSVFGLYAFKFATKIFQSIKSGDILNGLNLSDEVITSSMM